eukprot:TRINITY_DN4290_c0_g1_i1.p1 TRINITY_DN4290_c0_g1~~TRINITY_DN4290_c0_g1_i1.p1  ORF type:complete len:298 (-),score=78.64 TRINITY_DN4290_c0_g1_i1:113-1006(-)
MLRYALGRVRKDLRLRTEPQLKQERLQRLFKVPPTQRLGWLHKNLPPKIANLAGTELKRRRSLLHGRKAVPTESMKTKYTRTLGALAEGELSKQFTLHEKRVAEEKEAAEFDKANADGTHEYAWYWRMNVMEPIVTRATVLSHLLKPKSQISDKEEEEEDVFSGMDNKEGERTGKDSQEDVALDKVPMEEKEALQILGYEDFPSDVADVEKRRETIVDLNDKESGGSPFLQKKAIQAATLILDLIANPSKREAGAAPTPDAGAAASEGKEKEGNKKKKEGKKKEGEKHAEKEPKPEE